MEEEKSNKAKERENLKPILVLATFFVIVIFYFAACSSGSQTTKQSGNTQQTTKQTPATANQNPAPKATSNASTNQAPASLSNTGISSNVTIEVLGMETMDSIDGYKKTKAKGIFKIVHVKVTNNQKDAISLSSGSYKLFDDQGREFSYSSDGSFALTMIDKETFSLDELNPGLTTDGYVVFDVPKEAKGFKLQAQGGMTGDKIWLKVE